ncbi:NAD(P)/FAD-dependent oxidoreductase [Clostridium sp. AL.422]|uniref:NAD(P)/FAD-dependent oxidoreductase n=1 Tax=Clostridium TaxID=1485 RepID=UPI00293DA3C2|nr:MULTISPECIES: NAD(P)/FAD-dependent oxidoreductase [unclassified Clostridium]MDV4150069.1 NAD(P)/FAD-dependent oxidoreductase [Clostridium sp. AL.422]
MYDVVIIGAGIIGASIFRELTKYNFKVAILEKENDVSMGTTKANSAIIHAGYDPEYGTLMAKYNVIGNEMFDDLCKELSVPFIRNGSLVIAFDENDMEVIKHLYENGIKNNVKDLKILTKEEVLELEPNVNENIYGALYAPTAGIVGPFEYTIALVENAVKNGGEVKLNSEVVSITKDDIFTIKLKNDQEIKTKYVINAAGVYADKIHNMICEESFTINPIRGEYYVLDKDEGKNFHNTIFQCPSKLGKGVLVAPTVHGNLIVGPNAQDVDDRDSVKTTSEALDFIRKTATRTTNKINFRNSIRNFAGLRADANIGDFIIEENDKVKGFVDVSGIKSPGLTAAPAIALEVIDILKTSGLNFIKKEDFNPYRKQIRFMELPIDEKIEIIKKDKNYGRIICRCEEITEGEIIDAINRSFGRVSLDGIKRRCRPGMGRCQGGFCGPRVQEIIARELNIPLESIVQEKDGSYILTERSR